MDCFDREGDFLLFEYLKISKAITARVIIKAIEV